MIRSICKRLKPPLRVNSNGFHVLGIETSCDDTGAAVLNDSGTILGEDLISQARIHYESGGIIPHVAQYLHVKYIKSVVSSSMEKSQLTFKDLSAIAVTVKPGLVLSLEVGLNYAKELSATHKVPLIPIHHMEAHTLTARMCKEVNFPFLVFLMSGGHCFLALAKSVTEFYKLGMMLDTSPGQVFDRVARRANLLTMKKYRKASAGASVEAAASCGDPTAFRFPHKVMSQDFNCNFSFSGMQFAAFNHIKEQEKVHGLQPGEVIPNLEDLCASFQWAVARHMCQRLKIAMDYVRKKNLFKEGEKCLVVSGGVASNEFIRTALKYVCDHYEYTMVVPPAKLCTDNGAMIAWNGIEKLKQSFLPVSHDELDSIDMAPRCDFGKDMSEDVKSFLASNGEKNLAIENFINRYKTESETRRKMAGGEE